MWREYERNNKINEKNKKGDKIAIGGKGRQDRTRNGEWGLRREVESVQVKKRDKEKERRGRVI